MSHKSRRTKEMLLIRQEKNKSKRMKRAKDLDKETRQFKAKPIRHNHALIPGKHRSEFDWFMRLQNWKLHLRRQRNKKKAARKNANRARRITLVYNRKRP